MLFNSLIFLIFLPIVFCGYWFVFKKLSIQNIFIVVASYFFYGWWDWRFLFLIFFTTCSCYFSGRLIHNSKKKKRKKIICGINIAINIAILGFFKYFNFFSENLRLLFSQFGYQLDWFTLDVLLPVGISFYTFQAISYPIDVYRNKIDATRNFMAFTAFISYFPQLVAGPIERSTQLLPQFLKKRKFEYRYSVIGLRQILWGFFKKIVIADNCAFIANKVFENYQACGSFELILGAVAFSFQIYGDFSGYSDIAIGVSRLFGIKLNPNFHYPYFSRNIMEFWRRWHISLNTWFRDYVYIPLGGNRCSTSRRIFNVLVVFLLSGLWHGAEWTFVCWGAYFWVLYLPSILIRSMKKHKNVIAYNRMLPNFQESLSMLYTFVLVTIGWIIFRSDSIGEGMNYIIYCFSHTTNGFNRILDLYEILLVYMFLMILILLAVEWCARKQPFGLSILEGKPTLFRWGVYYIICFFIMIFAGQQADFIYFQF